MPRAKTNMLFIHNSFLEQVISILKPRIIVSFIYPTFKEHVQSHPLIAQVTPARREALIPQADKTYIGSEWNLLNMMRRDIEYDTLLPLPAGERGG